MTAVTDLTARRLTALVAREQVSARLPSLVAGMVRDGGTAWSGAHGDHAGPSLSPGAEVQYRIGSITKTMTAVLVLQLRDEGRLDLADRVDVHVPEAPYGDRTVRSLLAHSSGMPSEPTGPWWERSPGGDFARLAASNEAVAPPFRAGETYHYSNLAYGVLGELLARLRRSSWAEQVEQRILRPLGMARTTYHPSAPVATGYSVHHFAGTLTDEPAQDTGAMAPAGQLWSTLADLLVYARFLAEGHPRVLSAATLREMSTPQTGATAAGLSGGYGLGLRLAPGGSGTLVGHTGSMPGFLAGLFVDRERRTAAVCLANGTSGLRGEGLPVDLLEELERSEPTVPPAWAPTTAVPDDVLEVLGLWHWGNTALTLSYDGHRLVLRSLATGAVTATFAADAAGTFVGTGGYHHGERLRVHRNGDGMVNHLECATFVYTRRPYDPAAPIPGGVSSPG